MSTGNYAYDNFVRVDCSLPPEIFRASAIHEVAHFTLIKHSTYGLLCFFLGQDVENGDCPFEQSLHRMEQAFECVNECYAYIKELFLTTDFLSADFYRRQQILKEQGKKSYYRRYHMERFEGILLRCKRSWSHRGFPDKLFIMAANVDLQMLLNCDLTSVREVQRSILANPGRLYPDHRLWQLVDAYNCLLQRYQMDDISADMIVKEADFYAAPELFPNFQAVLDQMGARLSFRPALKELLRRNAENLKTRGPVSSDLLDIQRAYQISLEDCVIPFGLQERFRTAQIRMPAFQQDTNILRIFLNPEPVPSEAFIQQHQLPVGNTSAFAMFTNTAYGIHYFQIFMEDVLDCRFRLLFNRYPGAVILYFDDYMLFHGNVHFCDRPVFFRVDLPWQELEKTLDGHGIMTDRCFLQKYSDSVFFFFAFDPNDNVIFAMLAYWEIGKVIQALQRGTLRRCGDSERQRYGAVRWVQYRDVIAAVTEDTEYGQMDKSSFEKLRIL